MKIILFILIGILFLGCEENKVDYMSLAKFNVLCKEHNGASQVYTIYKTNCLLCKDGFVIKNYKLDDVYGPEVFQEYEKLKIKDNNVK